MWLAVDIFTRACVDTSWKGEVIAGGCFEGVRWVDLVAVFVECYILSWL